MQEGRQMLTDSRQAGRQKAKKFSQKNQIEHPPGKSQIVSPGRHFSWNGGITQKFYTPNNKKILIFVS